MPQAITTQFGTLDYEEDAVFRFPDGLPGFELCKSFVFLEKPGLTPLIHLQSLDIAELCFLAMPISTIDPGYAPDCLPEDLEAIRVSVGGALPLVLALLAISEDGKLTANLMAPVVVNPAARIAVQCVRADHRYSHQHPIGEAA